MIEFIYHLFFEPLTAAEQFMIAAVLLPILAAVFMMVALSLERKK